MFEIDICRYRRVGILTEMINYNELELERIRQTTTTTTVLEIDRSCNYYELNSISVITSPGGGPTGGGEGICFTYSPPTAVPLSKWLYKAATSLYLRYLWLTLLWLIFG